MANKYFSKLNGYFCKDKEARQSLANVYNKTQVDNMLSNYYNKSQIDNTLNNYYNKSQVDSALNNYYTKTQVDNTLSNYYTKTEANSTFKSNSDITILTGSISLTDGSGNVSINYPTGFNSSNCVPIAMALKVANVYSYGYPASSYVLNTRLFDNNIGFNVSSLVSVTGSNTYDYKIVLMKV